jgi:hypothetical protein
MITLSNDRIRRRSRRLALAALLAAGCDNGTSPGIQPEVTNAPDNFQFQVTALRDYTQTLSYGWTNGGAAASVNQASTVTEGSATLVVLDPDGREVYSRSLAANGTFATTAGRPGGWTIRVVLARATGTLNFRVQKRP